jgi:hypothetical protein
MAIGPHECVERALLRDPERPPERAGRTTASDRCRAASNNRFVVPRRGAAKPTMLETESQTVPALVAALEGILTQADWG